MRRGKSGCAPERLSRDRHLDIAAWRGGINRLCHTFHCSFDARPTGGRQHHNGDRATREVLLISEILVGCDQNGKTAFFRFVQQLTVFQMIPTQLKGRRHVMGGKVLAKRNGSPLVEEHAHLRRFERAGGVLKHGADLRERDTGKPDNEV